MRSEDKLPFFHMKSLVTKLLEEAGPRFVLTDEQLHYVLPTCIDLYKSSKILAPTNTFQTLKSRLSRLHQSNAKVSPSEDAIECVSKACKSLGKPKNISNGWSDVISKKVSEI